MTTIELLDALPGVSYRQLDHWLRTGAIRIAEDGNGSCSRRRISADECAAIRDLAQEYHRIQLLTHRLRSGEFYAARLAHHRDRIPA